MSYTDPNGWTTPYCASGGPPSTPTHGNSGAVGGTDWTPANGVSDVDMKRLDTNIAGLHTLLCQSGTVDIEINLPYFSAQMTATLNWTRINNIVHLSFPEIESPDFRPDTELQIEPDTVWPSEILPDSATIAPCVFTKNQNDTSSNRPGYMLIPTAAANNIVCYITNYNIANDTDGVLCSGAEGAGYVGFSDGGAAGNKKGIPAQTVTWMTDDPAVPPAPGTTTSTTTGAP